MLVKLVHRMSRISSANILGERVRSQVIKCSRVSASIEEVNRVFILGLLVVG